MTTVRIKVSHYNCKTKNIYILCVCFVYTSTYVNVQQTNIPTNIYLAATG